MWCAVTGWVASADEDQRRLRWRAACSHDAAARIAKLSAAMAVLIRDGASHDACIYNEISPVVATPPGDGVSVGEFPRFQNPDARRWFVGRIPAAGNLLIQQRNSPLRYRRRGSVGQCPAFRITPTARALIVSWGGGGRLCVGAS